MYLLLLVKIEDLHLLLMLELLQVEQPIQQPNKHNDNQALKKYKYK